MKKKFILFLGLVLTLACVTPLTAFAANENTGSTTVFYEFPQPTLSPDTSDDGTDDELSYSYLVNIPSMYTISPGTVSMVISAEEMNISGDKQLVVRIDGENTFESDGSFYLYLNGDKSSEDWILCNIFRVNGGVSSSAMGKNPVVASFNPGELTPHDWTEIQFEAMLYYEGAGLTTGTYTGTVYYTIGLE